MHDRADPLLGDQPGDQGPVGDVAFLEMRAIRHRPFEAGGKIVDHRHRPARVEQSEHRVAADIARSASHQHRQLQPLVRHIFSTLSDAAKAR